MAYTEEILGKSRTGKKGPGPALMGADTLIGDDVYNPQEENLGEIKEIMLDTRNGKVAYAVVSLGGFLGLGEKLFAVPWAALRLDTTHHRFVLDVDKKTLESAPGFDKDAWPDMADPEFEQRVHSFYGTQPTSPQSSAPAGRQAMVTGLFRDKDGAEQAYQAVLNRGYGNMEINLVMSNDTCNRNFSSMAAEGGIASAIGVSQAIPGLGLTVAGPIAASLSGIGASGAAGGLVDAMISWGIPDERVKHYDSGIKEGGILLSVKPRSEEDAQFIELEWKADRGEQVCR